MAKIELPNVRGLQKLHKMASRININHYCEIDNDAIIKQKDNITQALAVRITSTIVLGSHIIQTLYIHLIRKKYWYSLSISSRVDTRNKPYLILKVSRH